MQNIKILEETLVEIIDRDYLEKYGIHSEITINFEKEGKLMKLFKDFNLKGLIWIKEENNSIKLLLV